MTITEPLVVEEVSCGQGRKKRSDKNFRLIPASQYYRQCQE
jgi:hypothetical protein